MATARVAGAAELLEKIYATNRVEAEDGTAISPFPTGIPREHADEITRVVRDFDLARTLETGMAFGISTLAIGSVHQARGEGSHIAIDPAQSASPFHSIGKLNVRRAGLQDLVRVLEERADAALPKLRDEGVRLDFGLIDGRHQFDYALLDFFYIDRMLDVGGIVAFHDTWKAGVAEVVAFVSANRAYETLPSVDHGLTLLRKVAEDQRRGWVHHDFARGPRRGSPATFLRKLARRVRRAL